jgi:Na+/melibiose symporter-like transporter
MILNLMTIVPIALMAIMILLARLYELDGETHTRIRDELAQRYASPAPGAYSGDGASDSSL